ncbi:hypothetical protein HanXRQr2_Chr16g0757471 [Helianthus annuus]|uniref:Uncharacterized protein n=1 Tax=Helianthus annuus TaxID=4232 RepID=A0A9K3GZD9_HELAN|nr:hypothetical protein HanXRQr2_Chr16g0757471 [Helianthus annuus]
MAHLMHIVVLMISLYFRYRFTVLRLNFLSYSLLVMFLGFQGFLNHNKSSVMLPRSMAFSIFNSIQPVQEL